MEEGEEDFHGNQYSTKAIFYINIPMTGNADFFYLGQNHNRFLNTPVNLSSLIAQPFTILSSTNGTILCRENNSSSYHIFTPLSGLPLYSHIRLPEPERTHYKDTPAVYIPKNSDCHEACFSPTSSSGSAPISDDKSCHGYLPQQCNISQPIPVCASQRQQILENLGISPTNGDDNHPFLLNESPVPRCSNPITKNPQFRNIIPNTEFFIACAVYKGSGIYTFDIYDSETRIWTYDEDEVDLGGDNIILKNSGISCSENAYWLTSGNHVVVHDPNACTTCTVPPYTVPSMVNRDTKLQLGRVGNRVCLVVVNGSLVAVFQLSDRKWILYSRATVQLDDDDDVQINEIMRFEIEDDGRVEVVLCVGKRRRRLVLWESVNGRSVREVELDGSENVAAALANDNAVLLSFL